MIPRDFYLGIYEVTQAQYQKVTGRRPSKFEGDDLPMEKVSWSAAVDSCQLLTTLDRSRLPPGYYYRLPTEGEWEYAARAGTATKWSFGDAEMELSQYGWYLVNSAKTTHSVGKKNANPWGLHDMHGNVSEWCGDTYASYPSSAVTDPGLAEPLGTFRVLRGGSWFSSSDRCRSVIRVRSVPSNRFDYLGFRLILSVSGP